MSSQPNPVPNNDAAAFLNRPPAAAPNKNGKPAAAKFSDKDLNRWKREINPGPIIRARIKDLEHQNSGEYVGTCPPCYHDKRVDQPDKNPSFTIWKLDDGTWGFKCFGCGASGNIFQFVQTFDQISFKAAVGKVLTAAGKTGWQDGAEQVDSSMPEHEHKEHITFPMREYTLAEIALHESSAGQKWILARGITMKIAEHFHLGFLQDASAVSPNHPWVKRGWILFPTLSADGQTVTAVKYRSLVAKKEMIDGRSVSGILRAPDTSTTLFNLQEVKAKQDVWIDEGEPDTLVFAQAGLTAVGYPSASYKPTDDECELLSTAKRRFLAGDNDPTGIKAMGDLQKRLCGATYVIRWPNNRKDANDVLTNECGNDPEKFKALVEDLKDRATQTEPLLVKRKASSIPPKEIKWLWQDKIPLGKLTLFAGNPDNGKSIVSTSLAAISSTGGTFPETRVPCQAADVLMLIGEDDADDTAVPRLMAAQADLDRIEFPEAVRPVREASREIRLDLDIPTIEKALVANPNIRLITIDPISNYLGNVSMVAEQDVRTLILMPLKRLAEKYNVAVVIVMHLNKKSDLDAINRVGGAMAFIGVCRCSWLFARDVQEDNPEGDAAEEKPDTFSMLRIKNNLAKASHTGLSYSVQVRPVKIEGKSVLEPYVVWGKVINGSADDALKTIKQKANAAGHTGGRPNTKMQEATNWLLDALQDGESKPNQPLRIEAKKRDGISPNTLDNAYAAMVKMGTAKRAWKIGKDYVWQLIPMHAGNTDSRPQSSDLISAGLAE